MKLISVKKIFYNNLSEYYSEASLQYLYYIVISKVCKIKKEEAVLNERFIEKREISIIQSVINKLKKNMPVEYIFKETFFLGNKLFLNNKVFIPRPETEELVEWIVKGNQKLKNIKILDICTGSDKK